MLTHPDDVNPHQDDDGIVVRDVLEHPHVGVKVSGQLVGYFVHAQGALSSNKKIHKMNNNNHLYRATVILKVFELKINQQTQL